MAALHGGLILKFNSQPKFSKYLKKKMYCIVINLTLYQDKVGNITSNMRSSFETRYHSMVPINDLAAKNQNIHF